MADNYSMLGGRGQGGTEERNVRQRIEEVVTVVTSTLCCAKESTPSKDLLRYALSFLYN
jgi:hypothetical protein